MSLTFINPNDLPPAMLRQLMHEEEQMLSDIMNRQEARNNFTITAPKAPPTAKEYAQEANDMIQLFRMYMSQARKMYEKHLEMVSDQQSLIVESQANADLFEEKYEKLLLKRIAEKEAVVEDELPF